MCQLLLTCRRCWSLREGAFTCVFACSAQAFLGIFLLFGILWCQVHKRKKHGKRGSRAGLLHALCMCQGETSSTVVGLGAQSSQTLWCDQGSTLWFFPFSLSGNLGSEALPSSARSCCLPVSWAGQAAVLILHLYSVLFPSNCTSSWRISKSFQHSNVKPQPKSLCSCLFFFFFFLPVKVMVHFETFS